MQELAEAMAGAVVEFVQVVWPAEVGSDAERRGWNHMSSTAYQIGCMALVALGEAEATGWGALPRFERRRP